MLALLGWALLLAPGRAWADPAPREAPLPTAETPADAAAPDGPAKPFLHVIEISFGASLLYRKQPILTDPLESFSNKSVPVRSMVMLGEWFAAETVTVLLLAGIPLDTVKRAEGKVVVEEFLGGTVALGGTWTPFIWRPWQRADLKTQFGALLARRIASTDNDGFYPLALLRLHVASPKGTSMYLGVTYDVFESDVAVLYGVSQRF